MFGSSNNFFSQDTALLKPNDLIEYHDKDNQTFGFKLKTPTTISFLKNDQLNIRMRFESSLYKKYKMGIYQPIPHKKSVVTQFEATFARNFVPCFDEPIYRAYFKLHLQLVNTEDEKNYFVLSNMPGEKNEALNYHEFEKTKILIPAYLFAFAILNKKEYILVHQFNYFNKLIRIYANEDQRKSYSFLTHTYQPGVGFDYTRLPKGTKEAIYLEYTIFFTLAWCESRFRSQFKWDKLDFVIGDVKFAGMENPGLIFLRVNPRDIITSLSTIVHEIVHQWTGVQLTTDNYDNIWINEGTTVYITWKILDQLYQWNRIPYDGYSRSDLMGHYPMKFPLAHVDLEYKAGDFHEKEDPNIFWDMKFYQKAGNAVANLDDYMGSTFVQGCFVSQFNFTAKEVGLGLDL